MSFFTIALIRQAVKRSRRHGTRSCSDSFSVYRPLTEAERKAERRRSIEDALIVLGIVLTGVVLSVGILVADSMGITWLATAISTVMILALVAILAAALLLALIAIVASL